MNIQQDFSEFLRLLGQYDVDYLVIGGYAVAIHGYPRFTKDLDVFYSNDAENIMRLKKALLEFGFPPDDLKDELFSEDGTIIQFGAPPCQIDLLNQISGVAYADAAGQVVTAKYGDVEIRVIGKAHLLINKTSTDRLKDKADAEEIRRVDESSNHKGHAGPM
jgi:hypothetical protein